jgi:hypothetical protein
MSSIDHTIMEQAFKGFLDEVLSYNKTRPTKHDDQGIRSTQTALGNIPQDRWGSFNGDKYKSKRPNTLDEMVKSVKSFTKGEIDYHAMVVTDSYGNEYFISSKTDRLNAIKTMRDQLAYDPKRDCIVLRKKDGKTFALEIHKNLTSEKAARFMGFNRGGTLRTIEGGSRGDIGKFEKIFEAYGCTVQYFVKK